MTPNLRDFLNFSPKLGDRVYVDPSSVVIGNVELGDDVSVWPMAVIRGDVNKIVVGNLSNIQDAAILHATHDGPFTPGGKSLVLGKGVTVGHKAVLHACRVDDYCLIGIGAVLLDGVQVQNHVIIGAGTLVPPGKILESGFLYLGSPAKAVRKLGQEELEHLEYSAHHYVKLKEKYRLSTA